MTIICGTDLSPSAARAADAAAALAGKLGVSLDLAHVVNGFWRDMSDQARTPLLTELRDRLGAEADRLRKRGVTVQELLLFGAADEALVSHAAASGARLVVVSSVGRRAPGRWLLGSVAERTAETSPVPVLVVRDAAPFLAWTAGERRLRVMAAVDRSSSAAAAIRWLAEIRAIEACDVVAAYSSWPPDERRRLGTGVRRAVFENEPEIETALRRELERRMADLPGEGDVRVRVESCLGRASDHLVQMAAEEGIDLLVVGTHRRHGADRLWHGSVSRGVLHAAPMNVACVPDVRPPGPEARRIPAIDTVLAATDFSDPADRAVVLAYAMLPRGGTVHLVHVVEMAQVHDRWYRHYDTGFPPTEEQRSAQEPELASQLRALVPADAGTRGVETRIHIIEARTAGPAIAMAAERLGVDLICVGSHGRSGLSAVVAGSVAEEVIARSGRPVLVAGPGPI